MKEFFACFFVFKVLIYFTIFLIHLASSNFMTPCYRRGCKKKRPSVSYWASVPQGAKKPHPGICQQAFCRGVTFLTLWRMQSDFAHDCSGLAEPRCVGVGFAVKTGGG